MDLTWTPRPFPHPFTRATPVRQKDPLPNYDGAIAEYLNTKGFQVTILPYRPWTRLSPSIRVVCRDNENQDAILLVHAGDALIVNLNDSRLCGEFRFIRSIIKHFDRERTYVAALCSNDADMFNYLTPQGIGWLTHRSNASPVWLDNSLALSLASARRLLGKCGAAYLCPARFNLGQPTSSRLG